jgi:hypothetical protein
MFNPVMRFGANAIFAHFTKHQLQSHIRPFAKAGELIIAICLLTLVGCASSQPKQSASNIHSVQIAASEIPFTRQIRMHNGDAFEFHLPDGKTLAVWCEQPPSDMPLAEQTTKSGLKTAWGEHAFKRPEPLYHQIAPNSYEPAGWKSYIDQGGVTTVGDKTSEYVLFVDSFRFSIIEDLRAVDALPVTIEIIRR